MDNLDDFDVLKGKLNDLKQYECIVEDEEFEIGILNLIRSCVLVKNHLFFVTVKVFDSLKKFFEVYRCDEQTAIVVKRFEKGFYVFAIELHISESIEKLLLKRKWLINISVRDSKQISTKIVELSKRPFRYFILMKSDGNFVNRIDVKLILKEKHVEIPYQIYLKIDQLNTNILNLFSLNKISLIDEIDKKNLLKFTFKNIFDLKKTYKRILSRFYYNLDKSDFEKYNEDFNKWHVMLFGSTGCAKESIIMEFKFRNRLLKLYANPQNLLNVKMAILDEENDDVDRCISVNFLSEINKVQRNLNDGSVNDEQKLKQIASELSKLTKQFFA